MFVAIEYTRLGLARTVVASADTLLELVATVCDQERTDWVYQPKAPHFRIEDRPVCGSLRCDGRTIFLCGPADEAATYGVAAGVAAGVTVPALSGASAPL